MRKERKPVLNKRVLRGLLAIQLFFDRNFSYYSSVWDGMNMHETADAKRALKWAQNMRGYRARMKETK